MSYAQPELKIDFQLYKGIGIQKYIKKGDLISCTRVTEFFFLSPSHIQIFLWICAGDEHIIIFFLIIPWNAHSHNSLCFCLCKGRNDLDARVE